MICFDEKTMRNESFSTARIQIVTCIRQFIKGWIFLSLGNMGLGFDVYVKELGCQAFIGPCSHFNPYICNEDVLSSQPAFTNRMLVEGKMDHCLEGCVKRWNQYVVHVSVSVRCWNRTVGL